MAAVDGTRAHSDAEGHENGPSVRLATPFHNSDPLADGGRGPLRLFPAALLLCSSAYSSTGHRGEKELPVGDAEMMLLR
jgi:hypothetical protein